MDVVVPPSGVGTNLLRRISEYKLRVLTPRELVGLRVPFPDDIVCSTSRKTIASLARAQGFLRLFALCDIMCHNKFRMFSFVFQCMSNDFNINDRPVFCSVFPGSGLAISLPSRRDLLHQPRDLFLRTYI